MRNKIRLGRQCLHVYGTGQSPIKFRPIIKAYSNDPLSGRPFRPIRKQIKHFRLLSHVVSEGTTTLLVRVCERDFRKNIRVLLQYFETTKQNPLF